MTINTQREINTLELQTNKFEVILNNNLESSQKLHCTLPEQIASVPGPYGDGNMTKEQKALDALVVDHFLLVTLILCSILPDDVSIVDSIYIKAENLESTEHQALHACSAQCHLILITRISFSLQLCFLKIDKSILLRSAFQLP